MKNIQEYIPVSLLGYTTTIPGDMIIFNRCGNIEEMVLTSRGWIYRTGKIQQHITHEEMDLILVGWYTAFDTIRSGVTIKIHSNHGGYWDWIQYKN